MHYVDFFVVYIYETCEFYYCLSQSFVCHHKIVIEDLKILIIKILKIQKIVIVVF